MSQTECYSSVNLIVDQKHAGHRRASATAVLVAVVVVAALFVVVRGLRLQGHLLELVNWIRSAGGIGVVLFVLTYAAATVLFVPGSILTLGAGFAYGVVSGTMIVWVAANLGAALAFIFGRTLARDWVAAWVHQKPTFTALDRAVARQGFRIVVLTRLSPVFPFNLLNYAFGLTSVSWRDYVLGSMLGMLPGTVMYVYLGSLVTSLSELAAGGAAGGTKRMYYFTGLAVTAGVTLYLTRVARRALSQASGDVDRTARPEEPPSLGGVSKGARWIEPTAQQIAPLLLPDDEHNRTLTSWTHPRHWTNPVPSGRYNLVVVGGGTAGLVAAAGAAGLGAKVALIEKHLLGGDCLNVGCVPSKALMSAARAVAAARNADTFGVHVGHVDVDFPAVMERMRRLRAELAPHDSASRFAALGVDVFLGAGRFTGPTTLHVDGRRLEFSRAVITTGARAVGLGILGLEATGYLTNETVFTLTQLPRRLAIIGAGPLGCELAQAFRRFGSEVVLLETESRILPREDAEAAAILDRRLRAEGVNVLLSAAVSSVERRGRDVIIARNVAGHREELTCDAILLGIGRAPNVEDLGLESARVAYDRRGVTVNDYLQTTNRRIYAAGDVASAFKFTHMADALARIVLANALFASRRKASALHVPWCTYTQPEIAHVGMYEHEAQARGYAVNTIVVPMKEVDRAVLDGCEDGFLRILLRQGSDLILGATLVADHAGDMISEITTAMVGGRGLATIANVIHPYPTQAEIIKKAADTYNRTRLTPIVRKLFEWWLASRR